MTVAPDKDTYQKKLQGKDKLKKLASPTKSTVQNSEFYTVGIRRSLSKTPPEMLKLLTDYNCNLIVSQAVVLDSTVYVAGIMGLSENTHQLVQGGVNTETRLVLDYLGHILDAAGSSYQSVVKSTIFLQDIGDYEVVHKIYQEYFLQDFPVRTVYQVVKLPMGAKILMDVIAAVGHVKVLHSNQ